MNDIPNENLKVNTPITDTAKTLRANYMETARNFIDVDQDEQMEWVKNCPPDGWKIARDLEIKLAAANQRNLTLEVALKFWHDKFFWRVNPNDYGIHHVEESVIQECVKVGQEALKL